MKNKITSYLFTFLFILLTASIISITSIFLEKFIHNEKTFTIIISIFSLLLFLITSIIFGYKIKSKGLIHGIILSLIYLIFTFTLNKTDYNLVKTSLVGAKMLTIILGTLMGVNLQND